MFRNLSKLLESSDLIVGILKNLRIKIGISMFASSCALYTVAICERFELLCELSKFFYKLNIFKIPFCNKAYDRGL